MPRKPTGEIKEREGKNGITYALRFRAYGKRRYITLGTKAQGWTREKAERELRGVLADVERGIWQPPQSAPTPTEEPTFHEFSSRWLDSRRRELKPRTIQDYEWALSYHLIPFLGERVLSEITVAEVDQYKAAKLEQGKLGPAQINKTLKVMAMILDLAIEYELIDRANPARGRRRRVKQPKPKRTWVEPEQLLALIEAADVYMRPIVGTLAGTGLRIGEALALDWRDINLPTGTLRLGEAKTDAGAYREVDLPGGLIDILSEWKARQRPRQDEPVFVSRSGQRQTVTNVDHRFKPIIKAANEELAELGIEPISERVSPHSLRRTYASMRAAAGDNPVYIAEQLGHEDFAFTYRVYQRAAKRRDRLSGAYREAFDGALDWAAMGTKAEQRTSGQPGTSPGTSRETALLSHNQTLPGR